MSVFDLTAGESARIMRMTAHGAAAARLSALGFVSGKKIKILGFSLFASSVLIGVNNTRVALRRSVAEQLEVERCK